MTIRDCYNDLLIKLANAAEGDAEVESIPSPDNVHASNVDHHRIIEDCRSYLGSIFSTSGAVQQNQSAELKKMFSLPEGTITSNPLIKVAFRDFFYGAVDNTNLFDGSTAIHREISFNAFCDELDKIADSQNI